MKSRKVFGLFSIILLLIATVSCSKDSNSGGSETFLATLTTSTASSITNSTAISGGTISSDGGATVNQRGVCWSINHNPTIADNKTLDGTGVGTYSSTLTNLTPNTTYYIRAYATNSQGTAYGTEVSCNTIETMYFPPNDGSSTWETKSIADLSWNQSAVQPLLDYLALKNSKSFMILVNGRIVMENYFNGHNDSTPWYWASAGKTLTSTVTGIAEQEGYININNKVSDYIGSGWTNETLTQENLINCKNLLSMTSGIDDYVNGVYSDDVTPSSLNYKADAGTRWAYSNVYVKLQDVVAQATGQTWSNYFNSKLRDKLGMTGSWIQSNNNVVYWSTTRSMARFGLMALNNGNWDGVQVVNSNYFNAATSTSQNINLSYGYLWWLNGKSSYHMPQSQLQFPGSIIPTGPNDMFMALGKNDQKIYVIPSKKMVVIRMGDAADSVNLALSDFDQTLWTKINALFP
jgi:CubicO group peptidase (beta-lactamase class C family)